MRFTEHELTLAVAGAAKTVLAARDKRVRKGTLDVEDAWRELGRYQRYQLLEPVGSQVLPVLVTLPDVEVEPGTPAQFTDAQVRAAVEERLEPDLGRLRRRVLVEARCALVRAALAALPPRTDPDGLLES